MTSRMTASPRAGDGVTVSYSPSILCSSSLLSFHSVLLKACAPLEKALAGWHEAFEIIERIASSLENVAPRWQTLVSEEAKRIQQEEIAADSSVNTIIVDDACYFRNPLPLASTAADASTSELGVLTSLPGVVTKLALQHERQIEVAWRLLNSTQSEADTFRAARATIVLIAD